MTRRRPTSLAVVGVLLLVPGTARAQSAIAGIVKDTSGAVLPGVTVEAASDVLIEKARTVTTDGALSVSGAWFHGTFHNLTSTCHTEWTYADYTPIQIFNPMIGAPITVYNRSAAANSRLSD